MAKLEQEAVMITADELQNNLLLIDHHINDALEAIEAGEDDIVDASLRDIKEVTAELRSYLPERYAATLDEPDQDIGDIADEVEDL